ncbi:mechanosensitive ion channel, partial [bacterium]|nr:mechanosensitive ion channel [bacterium]
PFSVGHSVNIGGKVIIIDELGLFVTQAHEADGPSVMIPNSKIWGSEIINYTVTDRDMRRLNETVGIAYEDDIEKAFKTIQSVIDGDIRVLKDEPTRVDVVSLGDSSVNIIIQAWYKREDWWQAKLDFTKNVKLALDEAGISIPYPQRDVHLKGSANE